MSEFCGITTVIETQSTLVVELSAGVPGESAYQIAVRHGFVGTEAEWLAAQFPFTAAAGYVRATISGLDIEWPYFPQTP